jgi:hypothetical protein
MALCNLQRIRQLAEEMVRMIVRASEHAAENAQLRCDYFSNAVCDLFNSAKQTSYKFKRELAPQF